MARPANANAEATRARILDAALRLFADAGRGQTSVRDIARAADVSLGMVNHYFGSKDELYETCVASMFAELAELRGHLAPLFLRTQNPRAAMEAAVRSGYQFARDHRDAVRFALRGVLESGELDPRRREELLVPYLDSASTLLAGYGGLEAAQLRLPLQSLVFLVGRYAISGEAELAASTGARDVAAAHAAVADHLVAFALRTLLPPAP
ncbi:MAG: TetR/AcrR family transcriptional regulator [Myxococcales bacterium]|nr:TetR/AcrR family transcriptional regulator [Myxococcales bacterium]MCB9627859.1 TetR/AcrR family transcriptional regulator [Sandaracinaceae bacterium]